MWLIINWYCLKDVILESIFRKKKLPEFSVLCNAKSWKILQSDLSYATFACENAFVFNYPCSFLCLFFSSSLHLWVFKRHKFRLWIFIFANSVLNNFLCWYGLSVWLLLNRKKPESNWRYKPYLAPDRLSQFHPSFFISNSHLCIPLANG